MKNRMFIWLLFMASFLSVPILLTGNAHSAVLSRTNWTIFYVDSHETVKDNGAVVNVLDSDTSSIWHSAWYPTDVPVPHEVQIDLGSVNNINGFRYLPRPDMVDHVTGGNVDYGRVAQYEIYVSMSSGAWGAPVATGTFPNTAAEQEVLFTTKIGQYVRFRALTEVKGRPWTSVAELNVLGAATTSANYTVTGMLPGGNGTIACQPSVGQGGSAGCTITANLGYVLTGLRDNWTNVFSQVSGSNPYTFTINNATSNHTVLAALGATTGPVIPKTGWTLVFADAQEVVKAYNLAQYAFDSDPVTIWHTRWYPSIAPLPHQIVIDMGTSYNVSGFRYLPRQDGIVTGRIVQYEFYVSTNSSTWGAAVATGNFANDAVEKEVQFGAKTGRYLRLVATAEGTGNQYISVAELTALRSGAPAGPTPTFTPAAGTPVRTFTPGPTFTPVSTLTPVGTLTPGNTLAPTATPTPPPTGSGVIPKTAWQVTVDSQEVVKFSHVGTNAIDNNAGTMWHTQWYPTSTALPHQIQVDLGATYTVDGFRYLPRQDGQVNGRIGQYEFYVSADGINWGSPVATGVFANTSAEKAVPFSAKVGRYIRLRALSEVNGNAWTSVAELNVTGTPASTGSAPIPKTAWQVTVDSQEVVKFSHVGTNAIDNNAGTMWHTQWYPTSTALPHQIQVDLGATYTVDGFRYLPRQDGQVNGRIGQYEFYVSADGLTWGGPVATGVFANTAAEKAVPFSAKVGRYVRLRALSEVNGNAWTSVAELNVLGF